MQKKKSAKKKSGSLSTFILILVFAAGLSLLLYPSVSDYLNSFHQTRAIASYSEAVAKISPEEYDAVWREAKAYNNELYKRGVQTSPKLEQLERYEKTLLIGNSEIMGYIEIPSIEVYLPIYHGTSDDVLQSSVGHLDWTSVPTGGENTHCVLSGHRGLPSAKLFTHLDKLVEGDVFMIRVLDEVLTYEVDQILIVLPENISPLQIEAGKDLCTLVTCTPYGINSHRLLVRGHRIENTAQAVSVHITSDVMQIEPLLVSSVLAVPILILMIFFVFLSTGKKEKHSNRERHVK